MPELPPAADIDKAVSKYVHKHGAMISKTWRKTYWTLTVVAFIAVLPVLAYVMVQHFPPEFVVFYFPKTGENLHFYFRELVETPDNGCPVYTDYYKPPPGCVLPCMSNKTCWSKQRICPTCDFLWAGFFLFLSLNLLMLFIVCHSRPDKYWQRSREDSKAFWKQFLVCCGKKQEPDDKSKKQNKDSAGIKDDAQHNEDSAKTENETKDSTKTVTKTQRKLNFWEHVHLAVAYEQKVILGLFGYSLFALLPYKNQKISANGEFSLPVYLTVSGAGNLTAPSLLNLAFYWMAGSFCFLMILTFFFVRPAKRLRDTTTKLAKDTGAAPKNEKEGEPPGSSASKDVAVEMESPAPHDSPSSKAQPLTASPKPEPAETPVLPASKEAGERKSLASNEDKPAPASSPSSKVESQKTEETKKEFGDHVAGAVQEADPEDVLYIFVVLLFIIGMAIISLIHILQLCDRFNIGILEPLSASFSVSPEHTALVVITLFAVALFFYLPGTFTEEENEPEAKGEQKPKQQ